MSFYCRVPASVGRAPRLFVDVDVATAPRSCSLALSVRSRCESDADSATAQTRRGPASACDSKPASHASLLGNVVCIATMTARAPSLAMSLYGAVSLGTLRDDGVWCQVQRCPRARLRGAASPTPPRTPLVGILLPQRRRRKNLRGRAVGSGLFGARPDVYLALEIRRRRNGDRRLQEEPPTKKEKKARPSASTWRCGDRAASRRLWTRLGKPSRRTGSTACPPGRSRMFCGASRIPLASIVVWSSLVAAWYRVFNPSPSRSARACTPRRWGAVAAC